MVFKSGMIELAGYISTATIPFNFAVPALATWKIFYFLGTVIAILVIYIASRYRLLDRKDQEHLESVRKTTLYRKKHEADLFEIKAPGKVSEYAISGPAQEAPGKEEEKVKPDWEDVAVTDSEAARKADSEPEFKPAEPEKKPEKKADDDYWRQIIKRKDGPSFKKF